LDYISETVSKAIATIRASMIIIIIAPKAISIGATTNFIAHLEWKNA
jgi:hypothetical protein